MDADYKRIASSNGFGAIPVEPELCDNSQTHGRSPSPSCGYWTPRATNGFVANHQNDLNAKDDSGNSSSNNSGSRLFVDPSLFPTDRYLPIKELGQGALGKVYLCTDKHLLKNVAVKCLHFGSADHVMSFQQEAKIASRLNHDNVIKVLDFGISKSGQPYMVMEYFDGRSLQQIIADHKLSMSSATEIFLQVCSALKHLHGHDVYHRDLKPSNILVKFSDSGMPWAKLIDFGLSRTTIQDRAGIEVQGRTIVGTPAYMSPDQVEGNVFDATSEIYCLGCVLYEMYSGYPPFSGETALEILNKHIHEVPPLLSVTTQDVPPGISRIVAKCLEKDRKKRYQSIAEIVEDFNEGASNAGTVGATTVSAQPVKTQLKWNVIIPLVAGLFTVGVATAIKVFQAEPGQNKTKIRFETLPTVDGTPYPRLDSIVANNNKNKENKVSADSLYVAQDADPLDDVESNAGRTLDSKADDRESLTLRFVVDEKSIKKLAHRKSLKHLDISQAMISDKAFADLAALPNLNSLVANRTRIKTLDGVGKLSNLTRLDLKNTPITDDSLVNLQSLKKLVTLNLTATSITDVGVSKLVGLSTLRDLELSSTLVSPKVADYLIKLPLYRVAIARTAVDEDAVRKIADIRTIEVLNINDCEKISNASSIEHDYPTISFEPHISLVQQLFESANKQMQKGDFVSAMNFLERCDRLLEKRYGKSSIRSAPVRVRIAQIAISKNQYEKGKQILESTIPLLEKPGVNLNELLGSLDLLFVVYVHTDPGKCLVVTKKALRIAEAMHRPPEDLANRYYTLATIYVRAERWKDAEAAARRSIAIQERYLGAKTSFCGHAVMRLADCLRSQKRHDEAKKSYERALAILQNGDLTEAEKSEMGVGYSGLAAIYLIERNYPEALKCNDGAIRWFGNTKNNAVIYLVHSQRAAIYRDSGRKQEASLENAIAEKARPTKGRKTSKQ